MRRGLPVEHQVAYRKTVHPSGVRIVSESIPSMQSLSIGFWLNVGSRDEASAENGISHLIEHAVFKGTTRRKTHHIAQYLEAVGGYVNAFTGKDATCFYARVRDSHLERAVSLLADLVRNPAFAAREVEKEKDVILEEMRSIEDDPEDIINDYFERQLFGRHSLGRPVIGTRDTVGALSAAALHRFVREHYTAENLVVAASGSVQHERLVRLCDRALEGISAGGPRRRQRPRPHRPTTQTVTQPVQQAHVVMGTVVPGLRDNDTFALSMLNAILGDGMSSRLFQRVRERHAYAYNIYSFLSQFEDVGVFGVYVGAETAKIRRCLSAIEEELARLAASPVSARELSRAREQVIGTMLLGLESMSTRMTRIGKDELMFGRAIPLDDILRSLNAVGAEDVRRVACRACDAASYTTTTILPSRDA